MSYRKYPWRRSLVYYNEDFPEGTEEKEYAVFGNPFSSSYYELYVRSPNDEYLCLSFRQYFGIQWWNYLEILAAVKADPAFHDWLQPKLAAEAPIELLIQASLRILRGSCYHDQGNCISVRISLIFKFSTLFQEFAASTLYNVYVPAAMKAKSVPPEDEFDDRIATVMKHFAGKRFHVTG